MSGAPADLLSTAPDELSAWRLVEERAAATPDALFAVGSDGSRTTFAEYHRACLATAAALAQRGVRRETRVAWMLPTRVEALVLAGALARLGAVQIPLIPILRDREVGFILEQTGAELLLCPGPWRGYDYPALAQRVIAQVPQQVELIVADRALPLGDPATLAPYEAAPPDTVRWIFYTSGTTANPKGVLHTDRAVAACAHRMNLRFDAVPADRNALVFPVTHIGGIAFLLGGLMVGYAHILVETFEPESSCALMAREGVTIAGAGPVFWMTYVDQQRKHGDSKLFPALRALLGGGAPKPPTIHAEVRDVLGVVLATGYGMTECPTAAHSSVHDPDDVLVTDGHALDDAEIRIVDLDGRVCGPHEVGEIRVRGPMIFQGYLDPSDDAAAFDELGFHRTGDLGRLDERGVLTVTGRVKDIIIRKGENISAKEIEDLLFTHPAVADVAVIALPDRERGELACAVVVVAGGHRAPTLDELSEHCLAAGLTRRKLAERLEIVDVLPRNPTGKVVKFELQARYATP
jgi:acyl-CoA synthetase (AMP-forming)/AMP-acid ligase II